MSNLTTIERRALASVLGHCALQLADDMKDPRWGAELMLHVSILLEAIDLTFEDYEGIIAIGRELTDLGCQRSCCRGED